MVTKEQITGAILLFDLVGDENKKQVAALVRRITNQYLVNGSPIDSATNFTNQEIHDMRLGNKLEAVKSVKNRKGMSLIDAKHFVEDHGGAYLKMR